ncbi:MAG: hypothetical protein WC054_02635 [Candidatus Nanopelagicales bacterium]
MARDIWPPDGARVVRIKASHKGHPRFYVKEVGVVLNSNKGWMRVQLRDGFIGEVPADHCTVTSPYAVRQALAKTSTAHKTRAPRKRPEGITPEHGTELTLPIQGVR